MNKKLLLITTLIFTGNVLLAQNVATPNPGFENWTQVSNYWTPTGWNNLNPSTAILGVFTCQRATAPADIHSGSLAIKLTTKSVFGITANGIASTATLITTPPYGVTGGINYTERPDSIVGWYKYTPTGNDSGFVQFVLLGATNDTVGFVKFDTPNVTVGTYTRFSKAITYFSAVNPVKSYWILSSSDGVSPNVGSFIFVDDVDLIFNPTTSNVEMLSVKDVQVTNNLVDNEIIIESFVNENHNIFITDISGRLVNEFMISSGRNSFSLSSITSGVYFYTITNSDRKIITSGKLVKP